MKRILLNPIFYVRNFYFKDKTKNLVAFLNILGLTCLLEMNKRQSVMSKQCDLTGKKFQNGNNVSHAKNRTKKKFIPNLQFTSFFSDKLKKKIQYMSKVSFKEMKTSELEALISSIQTDFNETFNTEDYTLKINGFAVVFAQLNNFILQTQFRSFFAAFFVAFLCLLVFIKNIKTTLLVLIPNVLPRAS